jgi:hypothetical protein
MSPAETPPESGEAFAFSMDSGTVDLCEEIGEVERVARARAIEACGLTGSRRRGWGEAVL